MKQVVKAQSGGKEITIETGRLAKQADGAVLVSSGSNIVLVTVVSSTEESDADFFPLTVEYQERFYSTGKIPGGYFRREGKPTTDAVLLARLVDRPIRPSFPEGYRQNTQVVITVLSYDGEFPISTLASLGASAAIHISDIPFNGPTASAQIARVKGQWIVNPKLTELAESDLDMIVAGTKNGILMVEGECKFISEKDALEGMKAAHEAIKPLLAAQEELRKAVGSKEKRPFRAYEPDAEFKKKAEALLRPGIEKAMNTREKLARYKAFDDTKALAKETLIAPITDDKVKEARSKDLSVIFENLKYVCAREMILTNKIRIDGRDAKKIRPIACEVGFLPRAHGSGLFTRGETQVLGTVTLGTGDDEQMIDSLEGMQKRQFLLHYNFPPFSVGEAGRMGGQSRREIGHGNLAERALKPILPDSTKFPYVVRIVSEVLESNGSSSMGTVCSGLLALLDAGVPVKGNVAGIAMGLIKEGDRIEVLSDILGDEDHLGDMDFKVAGTTDGITAVQMDIKIDSLTFDIIERALAQAKEGRLHILGEMEKVMKTPRNQISEFAPRVEIIKVKPEKIREIIGPGGKVIKEICESTGVKINIEDNGTVSIASADPLATKAAIKRIEAICAEPEIGKTYNGKVVKITDFGAFVEVLPNQSGLLHISEISHERVRMVTDVLNEGDNVDVKVVDIDRAGRIKLSRKALLEKTTHND